MAKSEENPFAFDAKRQDPYNPYAAPQSVTEPSTESGPELADRMARFAGALVDGLTMIPVYVVVFMLAFRAGVDGGLVENEILNQFVMGIIGLVLGAVAYLVINGYLLAKRGQTVGKLVVGTRIVDSKTNQILPLGPLFLKRYLYIQLIALIPFVGGLIGLLDALLIFRENRRCLHDDFAGTKVIKV